MGGADVGRDQVQSGASGRGVLARFAVRLVGLRRGCELASELWKARCATWRSPAPMRGPEPAEDSHVRLHHPQVPLRLVVREGHPGILDEAQHRFLVVPQPQR